ncbi:MAG: hypothetical protein QM757_42925 [Paludibaculum sp.]
MKLQSDSRNALVVIYNENNGVVDDHGAAPAFMEPVSPRAG